MNNEDKQKVLTHINHIPIDKLKEYISSKSISFQEMKTAGLERKSQDAILRFLEEIKEREAREDIVWQDSKSENSIRAYEAYLQLYPSGKYCDLAKVRIDDLKASLLGQKDRVLDDIASNPDKYTPSYIKDLIRDGIFSERDLIDRGLITEKLLKLYFNPPDFILGDDQASWNDLPKLPKGNTDIYLFGIPGSGKSCILAGMFYRSKTVGILSPDITNKKGVDYMDNLTRAAKVGYIPPATSVETVNYISCSLMDNDREHPISIVEMSGEFFNATYQNGSAEGDKSIGASGYLANDNNKVIYFVVDYKKYIEGTAFNDIAEQEDILLYVLKTLEKDGTLEKTLSIQIIVSKSDLMPEGDKLEYTGSFLSNNYLNLVNEIRRLNKKYGLNKSREYKVIYHPFSLGKFYLGKTYKYIGTDSQNLLKALLNLTPHKRDKPWYKF